MNQKNPEDTLQSKTDLASKYGKEVKLLGEEKKKYTHCLLHFNNELPTTNSIEVLNAIKEGRQIKDEEIEPYFWKQTNVDEIEIKFSYKFIESKL